MIRRVDSRWLVAPMAVLLAAALVVLARYSVNWWALGTTCRLT